MNVLVEDDLLTFWEENGIICFKYKPKLITLDIAQHGVGIRTALSNYKPCRLYADITNVTSITKEARMFYSSYDAARLVIACAIFTPSLLTKTLASFFINFNKPPLPLKSFSSKEKAFIWLNDYGNEHVMIPGIVKK